MTGYGEARRQYDDYEIVVQVRAVNNRYFKFLCRGPEGMGALESEVEKQVRSRLSRGTVTVSYHVQPLSSAALYSLDAEVLHSYWRQLHALAEKTHAPPPADLSTLLQLPGAVAEQKLELEPQELWPAVADVLTEALQQLEQFRQSEGNAMQRELLAQCETLEEQLDEIARLAPQVVQEYRLRLTERLNELLAGHRAEVAESDLLREISLFADRCDINEEITRLRTHLEHFRGVLQAETSQGRKLEFLSQEMFREINTIGSKANNVNIAHAVVEMKSAVEKIREILQNVE